MCIEIANSLASPNAQQSHLQNGHTPVSKNCEISAIQDTPISLVLAFVGNRLNYGVKLG